MTTSSRQTRLCQTTLALCFMSMTPALAEDKPYQLRLGLLAVSGQSAYVGDTESSGLVPYFSYERGALSVSTDGITYDVFASENSVFSVGLSPRFSDIRSSDAVELDGINREHTADVVLSMGHIFDSGLRMEAALSQDVTGKHNGQEASVTVGYDLEIGALQLSAGLGATWQSNELANYTWGVLSSEATASRSAYTTGDALIPNISIDAAYAVTDHWYVIGGVRAEFLPNEISQSPIVAEDTLVSVSLGIGYQF